MGVYGAIVEEEWLKKAAFFAGAKLGRLFREKVCQKAFRAKLVKVAAPFIMRFAAKTKTESISPDSN